MSPVYNKIARYAQLSTVKRFINSRFLIRRVDMINLSASLESTVLIEQLSSATDLHCGHVEVVVVVL